ncbi:glutamate 5-kinase [Terribacillus saccharophilus]|uniref:glutamate 5-kinase n=1 Tax=Terribacillus saccharophilus TaxID=361277 RepID=UPI003982B976
MKRIIVKIGSSMLSEQGGGMSEAKISQHTNQIAALIAEGHEVILVSSGAVAAGFRQLGYPSRPVTIEGKQAAAAIGQGLLVQAYTEAFKQHDMKCAQLLLTRDVFTNADQYHNSYNTLQELLKRHIIPIINENDSVSIRELTFGDNDMLSAYVSGLVKADLLILITDVDGIYDKNPNTYPDAKRYQRLDAIPPEMQASIEQTSGSKVGTGGMYSKVLAAQTALELGVTVFIGTTNESSTLLQIAQGDGAGTYIGDEASEVQRKTKQWLTHHARATGILTIDAGAAEALLQHGKSLLPIGVTAVQGTFSASAVVDIKTTDGDMIARGISDMSSADLREMLAHRESDVSSVWHKAVVHRNFIVFL